MFGELRVLSCPELFNAVKQINNDGKVKLPKYVYPKNVLMVSDVQRLTEAGIPFSLTGGQLHHCRELESQKKKGKGIYGGGFLLSDRAAAERAAAERAAAERAAAERAAAERAAAEKKDVIEWTLSKKELDIISGLS